MEFGLGASGRGAEPGRVSRDPSVPTAPCSQVGSPTAVPSPAAHKKAPGLSWAAVSGRQRERNEKAG